MITKIDISIIEFQNKIKLPETILGKLRLQKTIDEDYYDIIIDLSKSKILVNENSLEYNFYISYTLKRKEIYNDLEEYEERLEIGL